MNQVSLIGRLTRDPERKGETVATFCIAVDGGWDKEHKERVVDFIDCKAFDKTATTLLNYTKKGSQIGLVGMLKKESWENKDGQRQSKLIVWANRIDFCGKAPEEPEEDPRSGFSKVDEECPF